jgi:hypothetical protein
MIINLRTSFQNIAHIDSLGMIDSLFPNFWILLLAFALLCIATLRLEPDARWLHVVLLSQLSLFLFYTPFALSGFSWSPDSLWHGGIATYMPEILSGVNPALSNYARSYPFSYLTTFTVEQVSGLNVFSYTLYVYPFFASITVTVLFYVLAVRLLGSRAAFLSMLFTLPTLHFIEPHVSPFSAGTILILSSLVLLTVDRAIAKMFVFLLMLVMTLTHPISPLTFGIFLVAIVFVYEFSKRFVPVLLPYTTKLRSVFSVSYSTILFLGVIWFAWSTFWAMSIYKSVGYTILKVLTLSFFSEAGYISRWTGGGGFFYSGIYLLNQGVYAIFLVFAFVSLFFELSRLKFRRNSAKELLEADETTTALSFKRVVLGFSAILYAGFSYMLFFASGEHTLLGRGLIFFAFTAATCMATYFIVQNQRKVKLQAKWFAAMALIFLLFISFPIVSYSKEAYNTYTPSSERGLSFIVSHIDLSNKSISMSADQQLAAYANLTKGVIIAQYLPKLENFKPDVIVLRRTSFFVMALRYDLSFENNRFVQFKANITKNTGYDYVYSNPEFDIYYSAKG